jgi:Lon protease-like protein
MIGELLSNGSEFGILLVQEQTLRLIGCTASVAKVLDRFPDGRMNILVQGRRPFEISMLNEEKSYLQGRPEFLDDEPGEPGDEKLRRTAIQLYTRLRNEAELENESFLDGSPSEDESQLSYRLMAGVPAELGWKQGLLELRSETERLSLVIRHLEQLMEYVDRERRSNPANRQII